MSKPCLVVFAALRSGTTMLRLMLNAHPGMACTGEHDFLFDDLSEGPDGWAYDRETMRRRRIFRNSGINLRDDLDGEDLLADLIRQIGERGKGQPVLMLHRNLDRAARFLPGAPVVHLVRDPRDVARSSIGMMWAGNVYFGVDTWLRTERDWEAHGHAFESNTTTIRYEDLVAKPQRTLEAICARASMDFDQRMLSYDRTSTYDKPDPSLSQQWRRKLTTDEVRLVEGKVGPLLAQRGYESSGAEPLVPSTMHLLWLRATNRTGILRRRVKVYGWGPVLKKRLGRSLGLDRLRMAGEQEIEAIAVKRLK